jgi:hypothetical protein
MGMRHPAARPGPALLAAAALLLAPPAALAVPRCATEADQAVFELEALKSELMVVGITCRAEDRYNAFVERYRPQLAANAQAFGQYFTRTRGRAGQRANDAYITNLAQARGYEAQVLGTDFCPRNTGLFNEVMALPSAADLPAYAAGKNLYPASLAPCEEPPAPRPAPAARRGGGTAARAGAR